MVDFAGGSSEVDGVRVVGVFGGDGVVDGVQESEGNLIV
jgi:hypothetical protein